MPTSCPECGETNTVMHPKFGHLTYTCGFSAGHSLSGTTPCNKKHKVNEGFLEANKKLVAENITLKEALKVAKACIEEAVATNEKVVEERDELRQIVLQKNTAIKALNEKLERLKGLLKEKDTAFDSIEAERRRVNKILTEQHAALADANIKVVQENQLLKLDLADAEKQMASMQQRIDAQAETIAELAKQFDQVVEESHKKPSVLGWLFCD